MIRSGFREFIDQAIKEERLVIDGDKKESLDAKALETEREFEDALNHAYDKLRERIKDLDNTFKLELNDNEIDRIIYNIKEKIFKGY